MSKRLFRIRASEPMLHLRTTSKVQDLAMSNSLAAESLSHLDEKPAKHTAAAGVARWFKAAMESLVAAQRTRFEDTDPALYRFPPL
jgi:hypothetical protein